MPSTASTSKGNMSSKTKNGAYEILAVQKDTVTRIAGVITPADWQPRGQNWGIFTILKSTHFPKEQCYIYVACVIPEAKYQLVIASNMWTYAPLANPGAYAVAALGAGVIAVQWEQLVANHKEKQVSYTEYIGAQEAGKELIMYGVGNDTLAPLKKWYIIFGDATVHSMINHLRNKTAIKMTTSKKNNYKTKGIHKVWDPTMSITAYFSGLNRFQVSLDDRGILTNIKEKTMVAGSQCGKVGCSPRTRW